MKNISIIDEEWDNLIILDACRYDFFRDLYDDYINGELKKVRSRGSTTLTWLKSNFKSYNDVDYVSSNPYINSYGVEFADFNATNRFNKIIDVWDFGWSEELKTVPPKETKEAAMKVGNRSDKRKIIHFLPPHYPYVSIENDFYDGLSNRRISYHEKKDIKKLKNKLKNFLIRGIGKNNYWRIKETCGLPPMGYYETIWRRIRDNRAKWKNIYVNNLKWALEEVSSLVDYLDGTTIVSADHGEALGEKGIYGHPNIDIPELREVPWLEIT